MGRVQHGAGPEEEQSLERSVVDRVIQPGNQRHGREPGMVRMLKHQRRAEADQDDTDVFDAVIGQKTFEVVFH